ncbi:Bax inhibitor-1/YccA family protein [Actinomyces gaoshouyii]|uniref:Bax1 inhibitor-like family protein n=1 Tax=Actinomyces gaoshouyii TaxID=1960083 RepID=A0A8H9HDY0_9ACTO|nr:Bax inhibitor-1/YccA family protein [Actinomyces gaoshouyii]ARD41171.1 hypothetical protein B6G06_01245 [Actinomyces gaoshouyii]GGO99671.1 hypothetical protein GCM10011612_17500 [Actinomyces gaoshouyii]
MSNPFFDRNPAFNGGARTAVATPQTTPAGYPAMPGYQPGQYVQAQQYGQAAPYGQAPYGQPVGYGAPQQAGYGQVTPAQLDRMETQYGAPAATNVDRGRMTYDDVIMRTAAMFAVILAVGAVSWVMATTPSTSPIGVLLMLGGAIGALVLGLVNSFKKVPSPALILAYSACEGAMLGAFSGVMEARFPGIVIQAVLASVAVFAVMLGAYKIGGFRLSGKAQRILMLAMGGYLVFCLLNFGVMMFSDVGGPFGLRSLEIAGIPVGIIVGLLAVVMAAFSLAMDFESIQRGVEAGLPTRYAWAGAFGLVVTLVWLYIEILRILAIFSDD